MSKFKSFDNSKQKFSTLWEKSEELANNEFTKFNINFKSVNINKKYYQQTIFENILLNNLPDSPYSNGKGSKISISNIPDRFLPFLHFKLLTNFIENIIDEPTLFYTFRKIGSTEESLEIEYFIDGDPKCSCTLFLIIQNPNIYHTSINSKK